MGELLDELFDGAQYWAPSIFDLGTEVVVRDDYGAAALPEQRAAFAGRRGVVVQHAPPVVYVDFGDVAYVADGIAYSRFPFWDKDLGR